MTTETDDRPVILWFRQDLRLADNPALNNAVATGRPILPVYILDQGATAAPAGAASLWWLDKSLRALDATLRTRGSRLILRRGDSEAELRRLIDQTGADAVFLNRRFEPDAFARDADIAHALLADGIACTGWNGTLLARPGSVLNGSGQPYKVFTPFLKALLATSVPSSPVAAPTRIATPAAPTSENLADWGVHPKRRPVACRPICISARSARGGRSRPPARRLPPARSRSPRPTNSSPRSVGANSPPICCTPSRR